MFGTQCSELIYNMTITDTHFTYVLLLHYLGKHIMCYQPKLHIKLHSLQQHPVYLYNQS